MPSSYQSPESQDRTKNKNLRTKIIAALVVLITAVTTTIYVWDQVTKRESSTETLSINQEPAVPEDAAKITEPTETSYDTVGDIREWDYYDSGEYSPLMWRIPITAPIEDFPTQAAPVPGEEDGCNESELTWLKENALPWNGIAPIPDDLGLFFDIDIRNEALSGGSLSLGNIRFDGSEVVTTPTIAFRCPTMPGGGFGGPMQELQINVNGQPAVYGEEMGLDHSNEYPEGTPVTLNLEPGENLLVRFTRDSSVDTQKQYEGRFLADIVGTDETVVLAEDVEFTKHTIPGYFIGFDKGTYRTNGLVCRDGAKDGFFEISDYRSNFSEAFKPCTLEEASNLMHRAAEHVAQ